MLQGSVGKFLESLQRFNPDKTLVFQIAAEVRSLG